MAAPPPFALAALLIYSIRSAAYNDPSVTVPSRVNQVEDLYRQNSNLEILTTCPSCLVPDGDWKEAFFNLQGDPTQIQIQDPTKTVNAQYNLSPLGLGHSNVWEWYRDHVIQTLGTGAAPPFPASSGGSAPHAR